MKKIMIAMVSLSLFSVSCATKTEQKQDIPVVETPSKEEVEAPKVEEKKPDIAHFYSGPNFMRVVVKKGELLNLKPEQAANFAAWREANDPLIRTKMKAIQTLEAELKMLSVEKKGLDELLVKAAEVSVLRTEIAAIKGACHHNLKNTLSAEQWGVLVSTYSADFPFVERSGMEAAAHVNPLPNYMKTIKSGKLNLSESQKTTFSTWSAENKPKIMKLVGETLALEKALYVDALAGESSEKMTETIEKIEAKRKDVVTIKTHCRDNALSLLDETQWKTLVTEVK